MDSMDIEKKVPIGHLSICHFVFSTPSALRRRAPFLSSNQVVQPWASYVQSDIWSNVSQYVIFVSGDGNPSQQVRCDCLTRSHFTKAGWCLAKCPKVSKSFKSKSTILHQRHPKKNWTVQVLFLQQKWDSLAWNSGLLRTIHQNMSAKPSSRPSQLYRRMHVLWLCCHSSLKSVAASSIAAAEC